MQQAANAYGQFANTALAPRDLEASLLIKAAARLQAIQDNWEARCNDLDAALTYNRKLWTILATAVTDESNPMPGPVKTNIAQLAVFIFNRTMAIQIAPDPAKLSSLVGINREIAAGLRARPQAA
jgi:flagellar protein FlaF